VGSVRTQQTTTSITEVGGLVPCQAYWVTTTAVNCGLQLESEAMEVGLDEVGMANAEILLGSAGPCSEWITENIDVKRSDSMAYLLNVLSNLCELDVSCMVNVTLQCLFDKPNIAELS